MNKISRIYMDKERLCKPIEPEERVKWEALKSLKELVEIEPTWHNEPLGNVIEKLELGEENVRTKDESERL